MTTPTVTFPVNDREYYPLHEEDNVGETDFHKAQTTDIYDALKIWCPDRFVSGNICVYWEPGNTRDYVAPDAFVADGQPDVIHPRVYHTWQDPPILIAIEIGSRSSLRKDPGPKQETYDRTIGAEEYVYADPPEGDLRFWRRGLEGFEPIALQPNGRVRSAVLNLEFGIEGGFLRLYSPDGERLRTHEESEQRLREEIERRQEAEARLAQEAVRREELERELAELRARLHPEGSGPP